MTNDLDLDGELWRGLDAGQAAGVVKLLRPETFEAGEILMLQGGPSKHAVFVRAGAVDVVRELPGGEEIPLGEMGPGAVIGEIGLMVESPRLATVRAKTDVDALILSQAAFRAACDGLEPAVLCVARNILRIVADRFSSQTARLLADPPSAVFTLARPADDPVRPTQIDFVWRDFLKVLPALNAFGSEELATFASVGRPLALAKGATLMAAGEPPETASFVLRGAIGGARPDGGAVHSLNVLGPGELCGVNHLLLGRPAPLAYRAREASILVQFPAAEYLRMLSGDDALGLALIQTTAWSLSRGFRRSNNTLGNKHRLDRARAGAFNPAA